MELLKQNLSRSGRGEVCGAPLEEYKKSLVKRSKNKSIWDNSVRSDDNDTIADVDAVTIVGS